MPGLPFPITEWLLGNVSDTTMQVRLYQELLFVSGTFPAASDFREASYDGYGPQQALRINLPQALGNGYLFWASQTMLFQTSRSNRTANIVNGWFMAAAGGMFDGRVATWGRITPSQDMTNPSVSLEITPSLTVLKLTTPATNP
jgi:hypothetical protein